MHNNQQTIKSEKNTIKTVTIFAGNNCAGSLREHYFGIAHQTGKCLAEAGFTVASGAGFGLMDECMRGAHEAGGHTVGIGLRVNSEKREQSAYIKDYEVYDLLTPRQERLISLGDAFVALPGGIGTLYEILQIIAHKRLSEIPHTKPLILVSDYFNSLDKLIQEIAQKGFLEKAALTYYRVANNPEEVISILKQ